MDLSDRIDAIFENISQFIHGGRAFDPELLLEMESLVTLISYSKGQSHVLKTLEHEVSRSLSHMELQQSAFDVQAVSDAVENASRYSIAKLEHEAMAKLVNKMRDRPGLMTSLLENQNSVKALNRESELAQDQFELRVSTAHKLMELVTSIRRSLEHEPMSPDLPPLSEVDPSLFSL